MRRAIILVILFCCTSARAEETSLTKQLDNSDLNAAAELFSQTIENGGPRRLGATAPVLYARSRTLFTDFGAG